MIDPHNVTDFSRSKEQLEEFLIFCICVAGKTATVMAKKVEDFLFHSPESTDYPFLTIQKMILSQTLFNNLRRAKLGKYNLLQKSFRELLKADLDLSTCSVEDLEAIPGVGRKTSRFFVVHTRPNQNYAILDTHVLKWLDTIGYTLPKQIASDYLTVEKHFLAEAKARNMTVADLDLKIWSASSNKISLNNVIPHHNVRLVT